MIGTIVNTGAILAGSAIGISVGKHLPERIKTTVMQALGLSVIVIGIQMALSGKDTIATIACLLLGAITGEVLKIEQGVEWCGQWLKRRTDSNSGTFVAGFVTASVLYCTGAMMIVGIGTNILNITKIRIGNLIPALVYAIIWTSVA